MDSPDAVKYSVLAISLCISHLVQGITGFGAIVLILPVLIFFFELKTLIPALIIINLVQCGYFAYTERDHLDRTHARSIVILSLIGLPLGYAVYRYLPTESLKLALGFFVVFVALWNLAGARTSRKIPDGFYHALNLLGGVTQGALASGGPFLVIYAAKMLPEKSSFRATLSLVWAVLNVILCATYTASGAWETSMIPIVLTGLPCVAFGTFFGNLLHDRIPQKPFSMMIYVLLLIAGAVLLRPLFM